MALPDTRHRVRYLFIAVMVGHILLISTQVSTRSGVSLLQAALASGLTETQRGAWAVVGAGQAVWDGYVALWGVRADNQRLSQELADLRVQLQQERAASQTVERLRALLDLRARVTWKTTGADVIGGSVSPEFRSIVIDRGSDAGLRRDMPVITPAGLVGRVVWPSAHAATVQLIVDKSAAAAVIVEPSRAQCVVLGNGDGTLRLDYLASSAVVQRGNQVVTAGVDGVYQKGIVVGYVERVGRIVILRPAVDFTSLESVLIVVEPAPQPAPVRPPADAQVRQ
ncbi:MAG: rod shape-determining protein MreC [Acidobacteria bacterium]|jgi:rod shape-determining protein MreC|nr:rod shape-determining protein MreC [Acidobacteriota bacterium]